MAFYQVCGDSLLASRHLKHKLVMDLQDHAGCESLLPQPAGNADHGDLDQVRRRPLEGRVGGGTLPKRADVEVSVLELWNIAQPSTQYPYISLRSRLEHRAIEPGAHAGEAGEVLLEERASLVLRDAELPGQRERPLPVNGGEVDRFSTGAHLRGHAVRRDAEDDRRGLAVDVAPLLERLDERRIAGKMRQQS